jgi:preprotein translocase subunit SecG
MVYFSYFLMTLLGFSGLFLIGLILLQRGRGGGLAGAFGGIGGQSAFGTKAGDVFTRITIGVASAWILLCAGSVVALHNSTVQRVKDFADPDVIKAEDEKAEAERQRMEAERAERQFGPPTGLANPANSPKNTDDTNKPTTGDKKDGEQKPASEPVTPEKPQVTPSQEKPTEEKPAEEKPAEAAPAEEKKEATPPEATEPKESTPTPDNPNKPE